MNPTPRLIIASNRLPFSAECEGGTLRLQPAGGGLAASLGAVHAHRETVWVGWPGDCSALDLPQRAELSQRFARERIVPVELSSGEVAAYYDTFCNGVLWPVFHYLIDRLPVAAPSSHTYRAINERFAQAIANEYRRGDTVWIHDYHLLLAPDLVRRRLPDAPIGFFLHTPFPATDVFRVLPWRREILEGLLGATLIGFQTERDAVHFADAVRTLTDYRAEGAVVIADHREVQFGTYPIGVDPDRARDSGADALSELPAMDSASGRKLLLGVDRLDYTKGIPRRLVAYERLLADHAELRGAVELIQIAAPSRGHVPSYRSFREEVEGLVARINGRFGTADWIPIRYLHQSLSPGPLTRLYQAADVMLVTSLRDGMNLVAKEFVAARADEDGVLVLSEFAGASKELHEALMVNPYATEQLTQVLWQALTLDPEERRWRMRALRRRVQDRTVENWANAFTHDLARATSGRTRELDGVRAVLQTSRSEGCGVSIAVMYEGVLVPRGREPNCPDPELLQLLRLLVDRGVDLHVISGETHDVLDFWFDAVPVTLWAEHGLWRREPNGRRWQTTWISTEWMADVQQLLNQLTSSTPGSFVEERRTAFVWHFGRADDVLGRAQGQVLTAMLRNSADALGIEVRPGEGTVEIRPARLGATALRALVAASSASRRIVLFHDGTDEDGPRALRPDDMAVCVSAAPHSRPAVCDPRAVRTLLWELADKVPGPARPASPSSIAPSDSRLQATRAPLRSRLVAPVRRGTDGLDFLMR